MLKTIIKREKSFYEQPKVSIIVSNYQGMKFLPDFFLNLMQQSYKYFEVIFVDAGSDDGGVKFVKQNYPDVKLIEAGRIGIGEAVNIGIRESSGDILIFDLNTDEYVEPNWLQGLVSHLAKYNFNIISGPTRIIHGTSIIDEAGVNLNLFGQANKIGHNRRIDDFLFDEKPVLFVGCPAFHRKLLDRIGMVDEHYFIYAEDLDFCYRARQVGIETRCTPVARSHHHVRGTTGVNPRRLEYFLRRANLRFHLIHSNKNQIILNWLYIAFFLVVSSFFLSLCGIKKAALYREKFYGRLSAVLWNLKNLKTSLFMRRLYCSKYMVKEINDKTRGSK